MKRSLYAGLVAWRSDDHRKPLILDGARQTGKTWLLRQFGEREFAATHYLNFESDPAASSIFDGNLSPAAVVSMIELYTGRPINAQRDLLVFDEVQLCPQAMTSLKYFAEQAPEYAVCCAGSLIGLSGSSASYPVGKVTNRSLFPLSFSEYVQAADPLLHEHFVAFVDSPGTLPEMVHRKLTERMRQFFVVGGMPEAAGLIVEAGELTADASGQVARVHSDLITGYQSDFAKHAGKENAHHLTRVFAGVPAQLSRTVDGNASRFRFKGVLPNSHRYRDLAGAIDWLSTTGLVHRSSIVQDSHPPLRSHARESMFKLYLLDIGLLHHMLDVPVWQIVNQSWGAYKGYAAENFTATELRASGIEELYSWQGPSSEVEFIISIDRTAVPIEVKSGTSARRAKSLSAYREKYRPELAVKVTPGNFHRDGSLLHVPLYAVGAIPQIIRRVG